MITSVNKKNRDKYSYLYKKASEYLLTHDNDGAPVEKGGAQAMMQIPEGGDEPVITSLDEYFSYIVELSNLDKTYTVLPLDEEVFEIDANTRTITVPSSFGTNGISVQGDEVAEIIYFKVNRYYDSTDLSLKDIYIQWSTADGVQGVSAPWVVDIESEPGYIIFGWPLSTAITSKAGTISFSVRFYSIDETSQKVNYSLSTLTAQATIKEALDYDLTTLLTDGRTIDDATNLIAHRFENTKPGNSTAVASVPEFIVDAEHISQKTNKYSLPNVEGGNVITYVSADLDENEEEDNFRTKAFRAEFAAISDDAGNITYSGQKLNYATKKPETPDTKVEYVVTKDTVRKEGKLYYFKSIKDDGSFGYKIYTRDLSDTSSLDAADQHIYEKVFTMLIDSTGYYTVTATNRVRTATEKTNSQTIVVPPPTNPIIDTDLAEKGIFNPEVNYVFELSVVGHVTDQGKLTYQWYRQAPGKTVAEAITGATNRTYAIEGYATAKAIEKEDEPGVVDHYEYVIVGADGVAGGDGIYYCEIFNNLNKEQVYVTSNSIRVTHAATAPEISVLSKDSYALSEIEKEEITLKVKAEIPATSGELVKDWRTAQDTITYEWYQYQIDPDAENASVDNDIQKSILGTYEISRLDINLVERAKSAIKVLNAQVATGIKTEEEVAEERALLEADMEAAQQPDFDPTSAGYYYCVATNTYNGTKASTLSRFFTISIA